MASDLNSHAPSSLSVHLGARERDPGGGGIPVMRPLVGALSRAPASSGGPAGLLGGVPSSGVFITGLPSQAEASCLGSPSPLTASWETPLAGGCHAGQTWRPRSVTLGRLLGLSGPVSTQGNGVRGGGWPDSKSSEPQLLFLSRSLGVSELSPRQQPVTQAWWSRAGLGG